MVETDEVWCSTCGKTIDEEEYIENDGDCDKCHQWWLDNALD